MTWLENELQREAKIIANQNKELLGAKFKNKKYSLQKSKTKHSILPLAISVIALASLCIANMNKISEKIDNPKITKSLSSSIENGDKTSKPKPEIYQSLDGTYWVSKEEYQNYQNGSISKIDNDIWVPDEKSFQASDGTCFFNHEDYEAYEKYITEELSNKAK